MLVDQLHVGPEGRVRTSIHASSVVVEGVVIGDIVATNRILLLETARVLGDLETPELIIQDGVVLEGACRIGRIGAERTRTYILDLYAKRASDDDGRDTP